VGVAPVHAQATTVKDTVTVPFYDVLHSCTQEEVEITGEFRITVTTTIDASGGMHATIHYLRRNVRGVGQYGTQYKSVSSIREHANVDADEAPLNYSFTSFVYLISQGGSDNLKAKVRSHLTVNANGEITAFVDEPQVECVG
jgi:hypothetical protein